MKENGVLTKDAILKAKDTPTVKVDVPEWGGYVFVRTMTGTERDAFEQSLLVDPGNSDKVSYGNIRAKLLSRSICSKGGARIFNDGDMAELGKKSAKALDRVFVIAQELSGVSQDDIETLTKNSGGGQSGSSTSN